MKSDILLGPTELDELIRAGNCTVVDCRYDFSNADKGRADWLAGHIPGAHYAHLDQDLAAPVEAHTGRHPVPAARDFSAFLSSVGWTQGSLLVAYDEGANAISARLWWLMRYFGQPSALLDGGLTAWTQSGFQLERGVTPVQPTPRVRLAPDQCMVVSAKDIMDRLGSPESVVLDARSPERYSGEAEYLDVKAGHIPGAVNRPFGDNLDSRSRFRDPESLRRQIEEVLDGAAASSVVHSCGSGVTACHNLFAMELAGMGPTKLYPGSWSEWIRDPMRPLATGDTP